MQVKTKGKFDSLVPIKKMIMNPLNKKTYGADYVKRNRKRIDNLKNSILANGLITIIEVYSDGRTILSGHHRYLALKELGVDMIPVVISDLSVDSIEKDPTGTMKRLAIQNQTHASTLSEWERYESCERFIAEWYEQYGKDITPKDYKEYGESISFSWKKRQMMIWLKEGRTYTVGDRERPKFIPKTIKANTVFEIDRRGGEKEPFESDLVGRVKLGDHTLNHASNTQLEDFFTAMAQEANPMVKEHTELKIETIIEPILKTAGESVLYQLNHTPEFLGEKVALGAKQDAQTLSNLLHGGVTKLYPVALKKILGIIADAPDTNSHMDIIAEDEQELLANKPWEHEIKTSASPLMNKHEWTSGSIKIGYHTFVRANPNFNRFFAAYVYVPYEYHKGYSGYNEDGTGIPKMERCWGGKQQGRFTQLKLDHNTLYRLINPFEGPSFGRVLVGDLQEEKGGTVRMYLDEVK